MFRKLELEVINSVKEAIETLGWEIPDEIPIEQPPRHDMGDIATSVAFELAGRIKRSPIEISQEILEVIDKPDTFSRVESKGPYLNFFINYNQFSEVVLNSVDENYGILKDKNQKVILEHTSANPNGPLHIGHIRNSILGDSLARILRSAGYDVETQYYVNDMGRQIAMIVWGLFNLKFEPGENEKTPDTKQTDAEQETEFTEHESELKIFKPIIEQSFKNYPELEDLEDLGEEYLNALKNLLHLKLFVDENEKDHEIGKLYFNVNQELKVHPEHNDKVNQLLRIYENGGNPLFEFIFKETVNSCLDGMKPTLKRLHVHHNDFVWESKFVRNGSVNEVIQKLKDSGNTKENEVLYLDLEKFGIEKELVLRRSDGTSLYSTRDMAYHMEKSRKGDIVIDVLGSDHKLAIEQIRIALEILGGKRPEVIFYEFITLPEGSMSTRRGVFISVDQLMEEAVERAHQEINKRREDLNPQEAADIAEKIGVGAIRYYIARLSPEKHIVFKWAEALSFERGCASIQYAHARACKLLQKAGYSESSNQQSAPKELEELADSEEPQELEEPEQDLIKLLSQFTSIIDKSAESRKVHQVAQYALDLSSAFNKFYKSMPVIGSDNEVFRLLLVDKSRITIRNSLALLGIDAPNSM